jgi:hypothetical protein
MIGTASIICLTVCLTCTLLSIVGIGGLTFFIIWVWPYAPQLLDVGFTLNSISKDNSSNAIIANITVNLFLFI